MHKVIEWIKTHKATAAGIAVAVFLITWLLSRSSGSSSSSAGSSMGLSQSDVDFLGIQAQTQQAGIASGTQVALAQIQANTDSQAISASQQVTDQQTSAALQATTEGYNTASELGESEISANENVANNQINTAASEFGEAVSAQQEEDASEEALASSTLAYLPTIGGSQNKLALIQSVLGQPNAASATEASEGEIQSQPGPFSTFLGGLGSGLGSIFSGLFGLSALKIQGSTPTNLPTSQPAVSQTIPYLNPQNINFSIPASYV